MREPVCRLAAVDEVQADARLDLVLDLVMETAEVGTFDWDVREDVLLWDERTCRIAGVDPEDFDCRIDTF